MYIQRGAEVLACGMAMCTTLAREAANGIRKCRSCSDVWRGTAGTWERLLRCETRTLGRQRMRCYDGKYLVCNRVKDAYGVCGRMMKSNGER
jgi:hypothetical protein